MLATWAKNGPPLYIAFAAVHGFVKPPTRKEDRLETLEDLTNYLGAIPGGSVGPRVLPLLEKGPPDGQH